MKKYIKKRLTYVRIIYLALYIFSLLFSILISEFLSRICSIAMAGEVYEVINLSIILILIVLVMTIFMGGGEILSKLSFSKANHAIKCFVYDGFIKNDRYYLSNLHIGEFKEKLSDDLNNVIDKYSSVQSQMWGVSISGVCYFLYLYNNSNIVAFTLLLISFIQFVPPFVVRNLLQKSYNETRDIEAEISDCILECIQGFSTIKMYSLQQWWLKRMQRLNQAYKSIGKQSIYTSEIEKSLNAAVQNILQYGVYGVLGLFVLKGLVTTEVAIKAIAISGNFFVVIGGFSTIISKLNVSNVAEKRLLDIDHDSHLQSEEIHGKHLRLENVIVYRMSKPIVTIKDRIIITDGVTLISGENGVGKTTLLNSLIGVCEDVEGKIYVGDINPSKISNIEFPRKISYIMQNEFSISMTPYEFLEGCINVEVDKALNIASEFGVEEECIRTCMWTELSGGEKKKILLSAAFAINPPVMLLDEPTNSLDEHGKNVLINYIQKSDSTIIIVTHDKIVNKLNVKKIHLKREDVE